MLHFPTLIIRASAGTGKTYQLANRFIGLLLAGIPLDEILAVTFTRKAAGEILDRVLLKLAEAADSPATCRVLGESTGETDLTPALCLAVLQQVVRQLHRLRISTLDSFFTQLAGSYSLELGFPPGWRIVDTFDENKLRDLAVESLLRDHSTWDIARLMHLLSKGDVDRPVAQLIRETVTLLHGVYLDAPHEAWEQFPRTTLLTSEELAATLEVLKSFGDLKSSLARANETSIEQVEAGDWESFVTKGIPKKLIKGSETFGKVVIPTEVLQPYKKLLHHATAILIRELELQTSATRDLLQRFSETYERHRTAARALQFDDISRRLGKQAILSETQPEAFRLDTRIRHVLLDEFQDTSVAQWQVLRPFVNRATGGVPGPSQSIAGQVKLASYHSSGEMLSDSRSLFCVGDVKQAIYGWRGGSSEIFDVIQKEIPGIQQSNLTRSFRSSQPIIDTVNRVFQSLTSHTNAEVYAQALADWQTAFQTHTTAKSDLPGYSCLLTSPPASSNVEQVDAVLPYAAELVADLSTRAPGRSIAVLTRRNSTVSHMIYELRQLGIAASEEGGDALTDSAAVELILSLMQLCDHPGNSVAQYHVGRSPLGEQLGIEARGSKGQLLQIAQEYRHKLMRDGYGETIAQLAKKLVPAVNQRDADRLMQLVELAYRHQERATIRTDDFVRFVQQQPVPDPSPADVRVTTIHKSKGLQFDVVVLPELNVLWSGESPPVVIGRPEPTAPIDRVCRYRNDNVRGLLPDSLQELFESQAHDVVTETLCLMYVAMTRAIHGLYMLIAPTSPKELSMRKSLSGLLRATLTDGSPLPPDSICFETGDSDWVSRLPRPLASSISEKESPLAAPTSVEDSRIVFAPTCSSQHSLERISPSRLEGSKRTKVSKALQLDSADSFARGSIIHAWFEQISWLEDGVPSARELRDGVVAFNTRGLSLDAMLKDFRSMLRHREVSRVLSRSYYDPAVNFEWNEFLPRDAWPGITFEVRREQRVLARYDGALLEGAIDRLVLIYDRGSLAHADIVDFKTDAVSGRDFLEIEGRSEYYRPQLEAYRHAVAKMFHLEPGQVTSRLVYLSAGRIMSSTLSERHTQKTLF